MDDQELLPAEGSETNAKKEVARHLANSGDAPHEDPSRATLHYGEETRPELGGETARNAPASAVEKTILGEGEVLSDPPIGSQEAEQNATPVAGQEGPTLPNGDTDTPQAGIAQPNRDIERPTSSAFEGPNSDAEAEPLESLGKVEEVRSNTVEVDAPINVAPTDVRLSNAEVSENADGAVIGRLSVIDANSDDTHVFSLSDDRFEVIEGEVRLKPGIALDHEEAAIIQLEVTAIDGGGLSITQTFDIAVLDVNEGPEALSLEGQTIAENANGVVVGRLTTIDPDAGDSHIYTVSDDRFEVEDGEVRLKPGVTLDFEEASSIVLDVTVTDSGGASISESFEISVSDVNEAPESVVLDGRTIVAGEEGAVLGQIEGVDPDADDELTFTVSDERFEVIDGEVRLQPGESVSLEEGSLKIVVTATDKGGLSVSETYEINIFDPPAISIGSGFTADYFDVDGTIRRISDIDWNADPTHSEITQDINYQNGSGSFWEGGDTDTFGARINGNIEIEEGGTFTFHLGGDDGAMLVVNGEPVIDNDGLHGFRTRSGEIELPEGNHHIEVHYFENRGHAGLRLEWEGPGIDGRQLVNAPEDGSIIGIEGVATALDLEIGNVDDAAEIRLDGLPTGTVVEVDDTVLTADESETIDLTGLDLEGISITPPIGSAGGFQPNLVVAQTGPNGETIEVSQAIDIDITAAHLAPNDVDLFGGFHASYFDVDHRLSRLDQIDWDGTPTHEEIVTDVNYENGRGSFWEGGSTDTFGTRIEGEIEVTEGGTYSFFLGGDDGAMLFINGEPLIDNDGLHGFRTRNGEIDLEPGEYSIEVRYFENYGHAGLKLEWQGPDTDGRELVTAKPDLEIDQNGTAQFAIDLGDSDGLQSVVIDGLPQDTILFLGEESFVSDGGPIDISGHDLSFTEISPPAGFVGTIDAEVRIESTAFNGQMTNSSTQFELFVGEDATERSLAMKDDSSLIMIDSAQEKPDFGAWTQDEQPDESGEGEEEDVMTEKVSDFQISESPEEQLDTYERYDW